LHLDTTELRLERRRNVYLGRDLFYRGTAPMGMKLINLTNSKAAIRPASDVAHSREWAEANVQNKTNAQQIHLSRCGDTPTTPVIRNSSPSLHVHFLIVKDLCAL
jgi:hypothetical protein